MDKYAIDRLKDNLKEAVTEGLVPSSAYAPVRAHLDTASKKREPQTEAKEIREDIEGLQCLVSDINEMRDDDREDIQQQLASLWCRVDGLHGMVKV